MTKFGFRIRTRNGLVVENLQVQAKDRADAERKLGQIYHNCEILDCKEVGETVKEPGSLDLEDVISLIGRESGQNKD
ncbi:MAG: hypothetical protein ACREUW_11195 [Burkholderiales bacterium]